MTRSPTAGRQTYWKQMRDQLFAKGVDGWWLDAPEPEISGMGFRTYKTPMGPGYEVYNAYPLMHSTGIYQGQRATTDQKRVVILTRSAYAGQQRNSAITWSGDIQGTWQVFKQPNSRRTELLAVRHSLLEHRHRRLLRQPLRRQWRSQQPAVSGAFLALVPIQRLLPHVPRAWLLWPEAGQGILAVRRKDPGHPADLSGLALSSLAYLYSVAWQVTSNGSTFMRPLVMDFPKDPQVLDIGDQYLFGPAIMVTPVTTPGATTQSVYLPAGGAPWYNFWTGETSPAGQRVDAAAPVETMPLFVRPGSIIPMGPFLQYSSEKPADPIELRIYRGANGKFTLYEDEGDTYDYEKGKYATIPISWDDAKRLWKLEDAPASFPAC